MEAKDIKKLFPKECFLTEEIISKGSFMGDFLLKSFLPEELWGHIFWGLSIGTIKGVDIKTEEIITYKGEKKKIALYLDSNIKEPRNVIFELR